MAHDLPRDLLPTAAPAAPSSTNRSGASLSRGERSPSPRTAALGPMGANRRVLEMLSRPGGARPQPPRSPSWGVVTLDTVEMSFLRGGRDKKGFRANTGLPFQPVSRGANEVSKVGEAAWEKEKSGYGGTTQWQDAWHELVGVFWLVPRIHEPSPMPNPGPVGSTDAFLGSPPLSAGGRVAHAGHSCGQVT